MGNAIFGWVRLLAPLILANIPQTRPIAGAVSAGIEEAEAIHTSPGSGAEKAQHVVNIATQAAQAVNAEKPGTVDEGQLTNAVQGALNTAFAIAKIAAAHGAPATAPPIAPATV